MMAESVKKVCIVGGIAGGMSCAMRLKRLREDIEIHVFERGPDVSIATCGMPYFIGGEIKERGKLSVVSPAFAKMRYDVTVHVLSDVTAVDRARQVISVRDVRTGETSEHTYDRLVLCPGARPVTAGIPGTDLPHVHSLRTLADMDAVAAAAGAGPGKRAVVIGCSFIGLEVVEALVARGVKVTVVELLPQVLGVLDAEMTVPLAASLELHGVELRLGRKTLAIEQAGEALSVALDDGTRAEADFVLLSIGVAPDTCLAKAAGLALGECCSIAVDEHMQTSDPHIYACGDAVQVRNYVSGRLGTLAMAGPASRQGRVAAANIAGKEERFGGVNGTAIVRVFEHVAGCTGLTEKAAKRCGVADVEKLYAVQANAVEWLPGSAAMIIKLLFSRATERVLGAQVVGRLGVDKRLDVLSTAIQAGMTVRQLSQLELTYAPPFGSPKDAVNTAGFIACNVLDGLGRLTYADVLPQGCLIVDLREAPELAAQGEFAGDVIKIPAGQLRTRFGELPKDRPLVVACKVGGRGNMAYRFLSQKGFANVQNLSGGIMVYNMFRQPELYKRLITSKIF